MSRFTSLAIGLLSAMAIFPATPTLAATSKMATTNAPTGDLHAQVIFKFGSHHRDRGYYSSWESDRYRRRLEWERAREARWRSGYHPRYRYYGDRDYHRDYRRDYRYYR